ncbi:MAG: hypothetical protein P9X26_09665 [Candidatus Stygibacter frigidus]|nr:hypothetical protein [Candidatus Stygibacter frigidus]
MKRFVIILLFLVLSYSIFAQVAYFGMGYNVSRGEYEGFNYVIDRYNETRDYLTDEMDHINLTRGMSFDLALAMPGFLIGAGLQYNRAKVEAIGLIDEQKVQCDFKLHELNIPFDFALAIGDDGFYFAPGVGINCMFWRYLSRSGEANKIEDYDYYKSIGSAGIHVKFFVKFIFGGVEDSGFGLILEPYYNLGLLDSKMWTINEEINPNTYLNDPEKLEKFSQFGVRLSLILKVEV